jgi:hypothetical protein
VNVYRPTVTPPRLVRILLVVYSPFDIRTLTRKKNIPTRIRSLTSPLLMRKGRDKRRTLCTQPPSQYSCATLIGGGRWARFALKYLTRSAHDQSIPLHRQTHRSP